MDLANALNESLKFIPIAMQNTSYNVIFVYSLLAIDLLVNIADKLVPSTHIDHASRHREISNTAFLIVLVQIIAIFCVVIDLVLHFFQASDLVRQFAWEHKTKIPDTKNASPAEPIPMPQRTALKLVLDKYWWSLLVGVLYLVVTIILQIVRLDPNWHYSALNSNLLASNESWTTRGFDGSSSSLRMDVNEQTVPVDSVLIAEEHLLGASTKSDAADEYSDVTTATGGNLLPIIVLVIHKLMSTCYYVSFVVVYRATPSQILSRIFVSHHKSSLSTINSNKRV